MRHISLPILIGLLVFTPHWVSGSFIEYTGDIIPPDYGPSDSKDHWTKSTNNAIPVTIESDDGRSVLHLNDNSTNGGSHLFLAREWDEVPSTWYNIATFIVRGVSSSGQLGSFFGIQSKHTDGVQYNVHYVIYPDRIQVDGSSLSYALDTTSDYNTYMIIMHQGQSDLWINNQLALSHSANIGLYTFPRNGVEFGAGSSGATGEAYWDYVSGNQTADNPIPEPSTILLLTTGLVGFAGLKLRRRKRK